MAKHLIKRIKNIAQDSNLALNQETVVGGRGDKAEADRPSGYGGDFMAPVPAAGMCAMIKDSQGPIEKDFGGCDSSAATPTFNATGTKKRIDNFLKQAATKVYLRPGEKAPEGVQVKQGKKGGQYYEAGQRAEGVEEYKPKEGEPEPLTTPSGKRVPPNWKNVWVTDDKNSYLQATGTDDAGRPAYCYSAEYKEGQRAKNFAILKDLTVDIPIIKERIVSDMANNEEASVLYAILKTAFRIGSNKNTKAKQKAYGISTLLGKHVQVEESMVTFDFIGKKGVHIQKIVEDEALAKLIKSRKKGDDEPLFHTRGDKTIAYLRGVSGKPYKNKDLRLFTGTDAAIHAIKSMPIPTTAEEYKKQQNKVAKIVSEILGNTPPVALKSYIAPEVFSAWRYQTSQSPKIEKEADAVEEQPIIGHLFEQVLYDDEIDWKKDAIVETEEDYDNEDDEEEVDSDGGEWYNIEEEEDIQKSKVYISYNKKTPEGVVIHEGKLGGKYYNTEEKPEKTFQYNSQDEIAESMFEFGINYEHVVAELKEKGNLDSFGSGHDYVKAVRDGYRRIIQNAYPLLATKEARKLFYDWQSGDLWASENYKAVATMAITVMMDKGMSFADAKKTFLAIGPREENQYRKELSETPYPGYLNEDFDKQFEKNARIVLTSRQAIREIYGNYKFKVYRGCNGGSLRGKHVKVGDTVELDESMPLSRWSLSNSIADSFATNKLEYADKTESCVLEAEVDASDVIYDGVSYSSSFEFEFEIDIDHSKVKPKVVKVYKRDPIDGRIIEKK